MEHDELSTPGLSVRDRDGVRLITWTRTEALNAMTIEMWHGTRDALDGAAGAGARCVVLTGAGRAFTVGQDLAEFADPRHAEPDGGFRGLMRAVEELQLPLVAAVNGLAVGFGLTVLPWCDLVLVGRSARFRAPFIELGVSTEAGASLALGDVMGQQAANRLLLTGAWMDADEAVANGLALRVADDGDLLRDALELATTVASRPPNALRSTLALMRRRRRGWSDAVVAEYEAMARLAGGEENLAAISAFFDRS